MALACPALILVWTLAMSLALALSLYWSLARSLALALDLAPVLT